MSGLAKRKKYHLIPYKIWYGKNGNETAVFMSSTKHPKMMNRQWLFKIAFSQSLSLKSVSRLPPSFVTALPPAQNRSSDKVRAYPLDGGLMIVSTILKICQTAVAKQNPLEMLLDSSCRFFIPLNLCSKTCLGCENQWKPLDATYSPEYSKNTIFSGFSGLNDFHSD